jgi:hypothetical protein
MCTKLDIAIQYSILIYIKTMVNMKVTFCYCQLNSAAETLVHMGFISCQCFSPTCFIRYIYLFVILIIPFRKNWSQVRMENLMEQNLYRVANKGRKFHFQIRYNVLRLLYLSSQKHLYAR